MRGLVAILAMLTGCDRVFGLRGVQDAPAIPGEDLPQDPDAATLDAPPGCGANNPHNEDLDTFPDECDNCRDLPNTGIDSDNDGVGDECDPAPHAFGDHEYRFWTCELVQDLVVTSQVTTLGDELRVPMGESVTAPLPPNTTSVRFRVKLAANSDVAIRLELGAVGMTFTANPCSGQTAPACIAATDGTLTPVDTTNISAIGVLGNKWYVATATTPYVHAQNTPAAATAKLTSVMRSNSIESIIVYAR